MRLCRKHRASQRGFTLLEVMVSLFILATVVGSLSLAVSESTKNLGELKQRQFANWVAQNQLNLYLLGAQTSNNGESTFAGIEYTWVINLASTDTKNYQKIEIKVAQIDQPDYALAELTTYRDES